MSDLTWTVEAIRPKIENFLEPLLTLARFDLSYEVRPSNSESELITPDVTVNFQGRDTDLLLAHKGELLLALEQLTLEVLRIPHHERFRLIFDVDDYRMLRIEELRLSAEAAAEKVSRTGIPFRFNPMTSRERRIIHLALRDNPAVRTVSEGAAPHRHTVVYSADPNQAKR